MNNKPFLANWMPGITVLILALTTVLASCKHEKDPDPPINVGFSSATQTVNEGSEINVTILLDRPVVTAGTVSVSLGGTAHYTSDYNTNPSGNTGSFQVTLAPGQSAATFSLASVNDEIYSDSRTVIFTLTAVSDGFLLTENTTFTATINDDESPATATFEVATATIAENSTTGYTVNIPFSNPAKGEGHLAISFASNNATADNFSTIPALNGNTISLTAPSGATGTSFTVVAKDDSYFHSDFVVVFEISETSGSIKAGSSKKFTLTIQEDESPSLADFNSSSSITSETGPPVTILIHCRYQHPRMVV
ncbi:MAG: Calx-beta domain-containing protein [Bacteroidota bacterium]